MKAKHRVIDTFSFHNEIEVLRLRVETLAPVVDGFVMVEANKTFRGADRKIWYRERSAEILDVFKDVADVTFVAVEDMPEGDDPWVRERHQRACIARGLMSDSDPDDIILVSDCDEIPNPFAVVALAHGDIPMPQRDGVPLTVAFRQDYHLYSLNWQVQMPWIGTVAVLRSSLNNDITPQAIRWCTSWQHQIIVDGGWHYSWLAPQDQVVQRVQEKAAAFAHAELDNMGFTKTDNVRESVAAGAVFWKHNDGVPKEMKWTDASNAPACVRRDPKRFAHLMSPNPDIGHCIDCGAEFTGFHACPGLPGENEF